MRVCPDCETEIYFVERDHAECVKCGLWVNRSEAVVTYNSLLWRILYRLRYLFGGIAVLAAFMVAVIVAEYLRSHPMRTLQCILCAALVWFSLPVVPLIYKDFDSCKDLRIKSSIGLRKAFASLAVALSVIMLFGVGVYDSIYSTDIFDDPIAWLTVILVLCNAAAVPIVVWKNWTRAITSTHDYQRLKSDLLRSHRTAREHLGED